MRLSSYLPPVLTFLIAALASVVAAGFAVSAVEDASRVGVREALDAADLDWAKSDADGLQVFVSGTAPTEAARFKALATAGKVVDAARVIDDMSVKKAADLAPPRFSVEILRGESGISMIGLMPVSTDRKEVTERLAQVAGGKDDVSDLLDVARFPAPDGWSDALEFALSALARMPRSKISVEAGQVSITAQTDSPDARRRLEKELRRETPKGVSLTLDISAPRPVITPFTLRFVIDGQGPRFDSCSADTDEGRRKILAAAKDAGMEKPASCVLGLGVPSVRWADAAALAIRALGDLGGGSVTFADADITLIAADGTKQKKFDEVIGRLENALPPVFDLHSVLPEPETDAGQGPPDFTATLSPEGAVQLGGRIRSATARKTAESYARAAFGSEAVKTTARIDKDLPRTWQVRVLAGLEALSHLASGAVTVTPDAVSVQGKTGNQTASADISGLLSEKLGDSEGFEIDVQYVKRLDKSLGIPPPEECIASIGRIVAANKINFEPGSATVEAGASETLDKIADLLKLCGDIPLQVEGYTDSQGRESMNKELSRQRAQAVIEELSERRVLTAGFTAKGFGEENPVADNGTEAGREANRRIAFTLVKPDGDDRAGAEKDKASDEEEAVAAADEESANEQN